MCVEDCEIFDRMYDVFSGDIIGRFLKDVLGRCRWSATGVL